MWLLSCSGDALGGKRKWLAPDTSHLLGRTSGKSTNGEQVQFIEARTVSRRHLLLRVSATSPADSTHLNARSTVEAVDSSKTGTYINGEQIKQGSKTLDEGTYTIKLGTYEQALKLEWVPVVLSFTNLPKKERASGKALGTEKEQLGGTGIKLTTEYITNRTTHVIANKRNTVAGLQALVQGRWLVTASFVTALAEACAKQGTDADGQPIGSALESDFDANWLIEAEHFVPTAGEPQPRPDHFLKPNADRAEVFHNYTFVFLATSQYESLMPVITSGGGKALSYNFNSAETMVKDVVDYVKEVAGKKSSRRFALSQEAGPGGIVIVRLKDRNEGRDNQFMRDLDIALDQRSIEQGEFLDAILTNDASGLRRRLLDSTQDVVRESQSASPVRSRPSPLEPAPAPRPALTRTEEQPALSQPPESVEQSPETKPSIPKRFNRRIVTKSRFQGFSDIEPSQIIRVDSDSPEPSAPEPSQARFVQDSDDDGVFQAPKTQQESRKRPRPSAEEEIEDSAKILDSMLPGAQAMKRRRTEALKKAEQNPPRPSVEPEVVETADTSKSEKTKRGKKDTKDPVLKVDVKAQMRARKEKEEELRRLDEESMKEMIGVKPETIDVEVKTQYFSLPVRPPRPSGPTNGEDDENWRPEWNGRKNFKKFRSNKKDKQQQREADGTQNRVPTLPKVLVRLEAVPKRGHELGDDYWLEPAASLRSSGKSRGSKSQSQSQSQSQAGRSATTAAASVAEARDEDPSVFRRRTQPSVEEEEALEASLENVFDEHTPSEAAAGRRKRPAAAQVMGPPPKRSRTTTTASLLGNPDDSDDDPTAFRRRRR